ncbi:ethylene-responsive transcription factor erf105, partial [Phtheirospermum japonicum]
RSSSAARIFRRGAAFPGREAAAVGKVRGGDTQPDPEGSPGLARHIRHAAETARAYDAAAFKLRGRKAILNFSLEIRSSGTEAAEASCRKRGREGGYGDERERTIELIAMKLRRIGMRGGFDGLKGLGVVWVVQVFIFIFLH